MENNYFLAVVFAIVTAFFLGFGYTHSHRNNTTVWPRWIIALSGIAFAFSAMYFGHTDTDAHWIPAAMGFFFLLHIILTLVLSVGAWGLIEFIFNALELGPQPAPAPAAPHPHHSENDESRI